MNKILGILEFVLSKDNALRDILFSNENGPDKEIEDLFNVYFESTKQIQPNSQLEIGLLKQIELITKNQQNGNEEKIVKIFLSFLCDSLPSSSVHKFSMRSLRSLKPKLENLNLIVSNFIDSIILEQYLPLFYDEIMPNNYTSCDKLLSIIERLDCLFGSVRNIFVEFCSSSSELHSINLFGKTIDSISNCDHRFSNLITTPDSSKLIRQSSDIIASLSNMFQNQFRLSNWLLQKLLLLISTSATFSSCSSELLLQYLDSIPRCFNYGAFAAGVMIEGSLVMVRLLFLTLKFQEHTNKQNSKLLDPKSLPIKCFANLICYIDQNISTISPKLPLNLLSAFMLETSQSLCLFQHSQRYLIKRMSRLNCNQLVCWRKIFKIFITFWPCRTESQFVYFTSLLYLNWTKLVIAAIDQSKIDKTPISTLFIIENKLDKMVDDIVNFVYQHWSFNSIEFLYEAMANCIRIKDYTIKCKPDFATYLYGELYQRFYYSKHSVSVYRLLNIVHDTIGIERFDQIFGSHIVEQYRLSQSLEHFLSYSFSIPALSVDMDIEDEVESASSSTFLLATKSQPQQNIYHGNVRTVDFIRFMSIRFDLFNRLKLTSLVDEMKSFVNDPEAHFLCQYFFKTLLPKLLQIRSNLSTIRCLLSTVLLDDYRHNQKFVQNYELISTVVKLNRQYNLQLPQIDDRYIESYVIQVAMWHCSDDLRLQALSFLIESKRTTEPITELQLTLVCMLLKTCVSIQQASGRDQIVKLFRKLFTRLEDSARVKNNPKVGQQLLPIYCTFLDGIVTTCFNCLLPQKYFGRLIVYLQLIKLFLTSFICHDESSDSRPLSYVMKKRVSTLIQPDSFDFLMAMIQNSFDEIRSTALDIQVLCNQWKLLHRPTDQIVKISKWSDELLERVQPQAAQTGVFLYRLVQRFRCQSDYERYRCSLDNLLDQLERRVRSIDADIMASAVVLPSYPVLSAIQTILCNELNLQSMADKYFNDAVNRDILEKWRKLFDRIIGQCIAACRSVSSIVCNDSPEGHLPMDNSSELFNSKVLDNLDQDQDSVSDFGYSDNMKQLYVTSQMLLLNGWMTVKESVIILSQLVAAFPRHETKQTEQPIMISCEQAQVVIDFLYENQLNLVHRGAFEQSSHAFNKLIVSLWKSGCQKCCQKFQEIITGIGGHLSSSSSLTTSSIDGDDNNNNESDLKYRTITRRSAGLPMVVQSILAAEPVTTVSNIRQLSTGSKFIRLLVDILQPEKLPVPEHWQIVHALNILKALVRDTRISERMTPWLEDIFKVTLYWFDKTNHFKRFGHEASQFTYSIQNSASMLFSALCTRVFGVKRNKADTSRKNRMSSLLFFQSYPSLYSFMLMHMENIDINNEPESMITNSSSSTKNQLYTLYPILIILSRLTPSISDNNVFDIVNFMDLLISIIYNCKDSRIRHLSVRVYAQLVQVNGYFDQIKQLNDHLDILIDSHNNDYTDHNQFHGLSLLMAELILQFSYHLETEHSEFATNRQPSSSSINRQSVAPNPVLNIMESIYSQLSNFIFGKNSLPSSILLVLHLVHSRIYTLLFTSNKNFCHSNIQNNQLSLTNLILSNETSKTLESMMISSDELQVNLLINNLVHYMPDYTDMLRDNLLKFVQISNQCFHEAKFVLWNFINESLMIDTEDQIYYFLLRKCHQSYDSIFTSQLNELLYSISKIDHRIFPSKFFIILKENNFQTEKYLIELINRSDEWKLVIGSHFNRENLQQVRDIQWDIFNEILRLIYNARRVEIILNIQSFMEMVWKFGTETECKKFDIEMLFSAIEHCENIENVQCTLLLILEMCLTDRVPDDGKALHYFHKFATLIDSYSNNFENVHYRRTAVFSLDTFLVVWTELYCNSVLGVPKDEHQIHQINQTLFRSLFTLLQDNEKIVRLEASRVVRCLAHDFQQFMELPLLPQENIPLFHEAALEFAAKLFRKLCHQRNYRIGTLFAVDLIADIFLGIESQTEEDLKFQNDSNDKVELCDDDETARLFDRSKQNIYYDGYFIGDLLIKELNLLLVEEYPIEPDMFGPEMPRMRKLYFYFMAFFREDASFDPELTGKLAEQYLITREKLEKLLMKITPLETLIEGALLS